MPSNAFTHLLFSSVGLLLPAIAASTPTTAPTATLLGEMRQAYGGDRWDHVGALQSEGTETADGLSGAWHALVDMHSGQYISHWDNDVFSAAHGIDAQGRWHKGVSGLAGPNNSDEAKALAVSEGWLQRFGFLTSPARADIRVLTDAEENGHRFARLEATPDGGRTLTLWIDPATHRLDHVVWKGSFLLWTQRYEDYRNVDGLQLPFRVSTSSTLANGGAHGTTTDVASSIRVLPTVAVDQLKRPSPVVRDVAMAHGATEAMVPMHVEGGALLVEASIDGKGPMPFILDTGGQAVLTAEAAKRLGIQGKGQGVSAGAGPGSMTTAYAKVDHLTLGDADIRDQTFVVMPYPYSFYERGTGREPIAGLLGLEVFQRFAVTFDYDRGQLVLQPYDHGDAPAAKKGQVLPIRFTDDLPLVHATLDGKSGIFDIDTGNAGYTSVYPQWAQQQGLYPYYAKGLPYLTGGVGGLYEAHLSHAHSLQLGGTTLNEVLALLTRADSGATGNPSEAGNIGQDVLARFKVHMDYRRGEMVLMPREKTPAWHYAMAGFRAEKTEDRADRYRVTAVIPGSPAEQTGLKKGDEIVTVNGKQASALSIGDLWDLISLLPDGTSLTLGLADGRTVTMALRDIAPR